MAGFLTNRGIEELLCIVGGMKTFDAEKDLWICLSLAKAHRSGRLSEPTAPSYMRVRFWNSFFWDQDIRGELVNAHEVVFPHPVEDWGIVQSVAVMVGNIVFAMADLDNPKVIKAGDEPARIKIGNLRISMR